MGAPEEKVELKNENAAYTFTTKGGGISEVVLLDTKDHVRLNLLGKAPIGALTDAAKTYQDSLPYRIVDKTAQSVVFEAETPDKVVVRKAYSFPQGLQPTTTTWTSSLRSRIAPARSSPRTATSSTPAPPTS